MFVIVHYEKFKKVSPQCNIAVHVKRSVVTVLRWVKTGSVLEKHSSDYKPQTTNLRKFMHETCGSLIALQVWPEIGGHFRVNNLDAM